MNTGKVKFFNNEKGFGFIIDDESKKDIFVHKTGLKQRINEDDQVSYDTEDGPKGTSAINVQIIEPS